MNTYLGVSSLLGPDDVDEALVARGRGRLPRGLPVRPRRRPRRPTARPPPSPTPPGGKVSLTLSDSFCVDRHRADFFRPRRPTEVDILFANEAELMALYEVDDFDDALAGRARPLRDRRRHPRQGRARWSSRRDERARRSPPTRSPRWSTPPAPATSTPPASSTASPTATSLADCGRLGSLAAAEVISHVGARPLVVAAPPGRDARPAADALGRSGRMPRVGALGQDAPA